MPNNEAVQAVRDNPDALLACILDMGEVLIASGAEIVRVEDTVTRICKAYGFVKTDVFSITSSIVITAQCPDERVITQTRRITNRSTNLERVAQVNALSRKVCQNPLSVAEFRERIANIRNGKSYHPAVLYISYAIISACFSVFFGGTAWDALAASLSGIWVFMVQQYLGKLKMNGVLYSLIASALTALVVVLLVRCGIGENPEMINIGNIMLLIPGVGFTTALRDLTNGDTLSGLVGLSESVIKAIAIAIGFAVVLVGIGGIL